MLPSPHWTCQVSPALLRDLIKYFIAYTFHACEVLRVPASASADWIVDSEIGLRSSSWKGWGPKAILGSIGPIVAGQKQLKRKTLEMGQNIMTFVVIVLEFWLGWSQSSVLALKDEGAQFPGDGSIKWIGFPKLWLGYGGAVIALTILLIALANASASWLVVPNVSLEFHPKFDVCRFGLWWHVYWGWQMGWSVGTWIEFPEGPEKWIDLQVLLLFRSLSGTLGRTMSSKVEMF